MRYQANTAKLWCAMKRSSDPRSIASPESIQTAVTAEMLDEIHFMLRRLLSWAEEDADWLRSVGQEP